MNINHNPPNDLDPVTQLFQLVFWMIIIDALVAVIVYWSTH